MAPFIAIFFSCFFWTCVAIRDCIDPPDQRLERQRRLRHYRKKKKAAQKKHNDFHKDQASSKLARYKADVKKWKAELKLAKKTGVPEPDWPKKPDKELYTHEKPKFEYDNLKKMRKTSRARRLGTKPEAETKADKKGSKKEEEEKKKKKKKKKKATGKIESKSKVEVMDAAMPNNTVHKEYETAKAKPSKSQKKKIRIKKPATPAKAPNSPTNSKKLHSPKQSRSLKKVAPVAGNAFDDYDETDNDTLLAQVALFQGADSAAAHSDKTMKDKIQQHMRVSAEMSKDELGKFDKFVATNVTLMYLCYPVLIKSTFQLVACMPIGKNMYLQMDLNVPCYVGQHLFFTLNLFLPAFICWVVGLPLVGFFIMKRNRHKLYERNMKFRYGTLYTGYTLQCYYWECVISIRKCFVLATSVFLTTAGAESQALCGMMICMISLILHLNWKPFIKVAKGRHTLFWAEFWALFVAFLTFWTGLFFFQDVASSGPLQMFFTVELISVNSFFCLMALRWFLILKLMDTQDLIMTRELQGAQEEELKGNRSTVSWLQQLVPEWRHVSHLWAKKAWKSTIKHQIMARRSLNAFGPISLAAAANSSNAGGGVAGGAGGAGKSASAANGNGKMNWAQQSRRRRSSFSTHAQKKLHTDALSALGLGATNNALAAAHHIKMRSERKAKRRSLGFKLVRKKRTSMKKIVPGGNKSQKELDPVEEARRTRARRKAMKKIRRVVKAIGISEVLTATQATSAFAAAGKEMRSNRSEVSIFPAPAAATTGARPQPLPTKNGGKARIRPLPTKGGGKASNPSPVAIESQTEKALDGGSGEPRPQPRSSAEEKAKPAAKPRPSSQPGAGLAVAAAAAKPKPKPRPSAAGKAKPAAKPRPSSQPDAGLAAAAAKPKPKPRPSAAGKAKPAAKPRPSSTPKTAARPRPTPKRKADKPQSSPPANKE